MSLRSRVVTFNIGTGAIAGSTVSQDHFLGEAPKVIIFFWVGATVVSGQGTVAANWRPGMGFANCIPGTPVNAGVGVRAENGQAAGTRSARGVVSAVSCVVVPLSASAGLGAALHVSSVNATQFTMMIDTQFANAMRITALCLSGEDIASAAVGVATGPGATGNFDVTGLGFNPQGGGRSLLLMGHTDQATLETAEVPAQIGFGAAISATERCIVAAFAKNATSPTACYRYNYGSECGGVPANASLGSATGRKDFVSWITDGFRLNLLELGIASERMPYLVIDGPRFNISKATTSASLGGRVTLSGLAYRPEAGLVMGTHDAESAQDTCTTDAILTVAAWSQRYDQQVEAGSDQNAVTTTVGSGALDYYGSYLGLTGAGAIDTAMALETITPDGAVYVMTNATPVGSKNFFTVFMGPASSAPAARTTVASSHIWSWM